MENLNKTHIIILEFLELLSFEPISLYELEKKTKRNFSTIKSQINFLEMIGLVTIKKVPKGKLSQAKVT